MRNRNAHSAFIRGLICAVLAGMSFDSVAQVGPASARLVASESRVRPPKHEGSSTVSLDLAVSSQGEVTDATVKKSSGDFAFDERVRQFYLRLRAIPAIDALGQRVAGTIGVHYLQAANAGSRQSRRAKIPAIGPATAEAERISRMTCKDFTWEYDLLRQIARRDSYIARDQLPRISLAVFLGSNRLTDREIKTLNRALGRMTAESAAKCRARPASKYWVDVFEPLARARVNKHVKPASGSALAALVEVPDHAPSISP